MTLFCEMTTQTKGHYCCNMCQAWSGCEDPHGPHCTKHIDLWKCLAENYGGKYPFINAGNGVWECDLCNGTTCTLKHLKSIAHNKAFCKSGRNYISWVEAGRPEGEDRLTFIGGPRKWGNGAYQPGENAQSREDVRPSRTKAPPPTVASAKMVAPPKETYESGKKAPPRRKLSTPQDSEASAFAANSYNREDCKQASQNA